MSNCVNNPEPGTPKPEIKPPAQQSQPSLGTCNYCGEAAVAATRMVIELPPKDGYRQYKAEPGSIPYCSFHRSQAIDASCCNSGHYDEAWDDGLLVGMKRALTCDTAEDMAKPLLTPKKIEFQEHVCATCGEKAVGMTLRAKQAGPIMSHGETLHNASAVCWCEDHKPGEDA